MQTTLRQIAPSSTPYRVEGVPPAIAEQLWPDVEPLLLPALVRGGDNTTPEDVLRYILERRCMLWLVTTDEIVAAMVIHLPEDRDSLMIWLMGGKDFDEWRETAQPLLQRYARERGRRCVEAYARPGLAKKLRQHGWRTRYELVTI